MWINYYTLYDMFILATQLQSEKDFFFLSHSFVRCVQHSKSNKNYLGHFISLRIQQMLIRFCCHRNCSHLEWQQQQHNNKKTKIGNCLSVMYINTINLKSPYVYDNANCICVCVCVHICAQFLVKPLKTK